MDMPYTPSIVSSICNAASENSTVDTWTNSFLPNTTEHSIPPSPGWNTTRTPNWNVSLTSNELATISGFLLGIPSWGIPDHAIYMIVTALIILSIVRRRGEKRGDDVKPRKTSPRNNASVISKLTFWWMTKSILAWYKTPMTEDDLWELNEDEKTKHIYPNFDKELQALIKQNLKKYSSKSASSEQFKPQKIDSDVSSDLRAKDGQLTKASIIWALVKVTWRPLMLNNLFRFGHNLIDFAGPMLQGLLIGFAELPAEERAAQSWRGYFYACLILGYSLISLVCEKQFVHYVLIFGMQVRSCLMAAVYKKALTVSNGARRETTVGEIVNLMSTDVRRLRNSCHNIWTLWSIALHIVITVYMLYQYLGPSVFAGLGFMFIIIPVNVTLVKSLKKIERKQMNLKDNRIKLVNEVLNGIKVLKLYAWELSFKDKLSKLRDVEVEHMMKTKTLHSFNHLFWTMMSFCVMLITLTVYVLSGNALNAQKVFVSLSLFNMLQWAIGTMPQVVTQFVNANVSFERLIKFLSQDDISDNNVEHDAYTENPIEVVDGNFAWDNKGSPVIKDINMSVKPGSLVAVVGSVGAGKSTLLSAILGETEKISGQVKVNGTIAYAAQQAWVQNATLKNNILFHSDFEEEKYEKVLDNCCLRADIAILPGADITEIGEKGINLSGGQKQRVSLARAVYREADIYLLDDPLSAVDAHVGKHIFDKCIGKNSMLKDKTRILVTHGLHWLPHVDQVLVVSGGIISESGTYQELLERDGDFAQILKTHSMPSKNTTKTGNGAGDNGDTEEDGEEKNSEEKKEAPVDRGKLVEDENKDTDEVKWRSLLTYVRACGVFPLVMIAGASLLHRASDIASDVCLERWTNDPILNRETSSDNPDFIQARNSYLSSYGLLGLVRAIIVLSSALYTGRVLLRASSRLHNQMLHSILRAPMTFFDTTPTGRILNRFSGDLSTMDHSNILNDLVCSVIALLSCGIVVTTYTSPMLIGLLIVLAMFYVMVQRLYVASSRHLRRLESSTSSPIFAHFSESIAGATTIRAYGMQETFSNHSAKLADHNMNVLFIKWSSDRWMDMIISTISKLVVFASTLFALQGNHAGGAMGIILTYSLNVCNILGGLVWRMTDIEHYVIAVDRIAEYSNTKPEAEWRVEETQPPKEWPQNGAVKFSNYGTRYREGLDLVVKDININIKGGEKIGIVGRTGAGKSSLTLALFRIIERVMGEIQIDDIALHNLGLHQLRSKLTILPQDPVLFSGTLRMNLDPFDQYSDDDLHRALETAHLKDYVDSLEDGLNHECGEGGQNLSVGQRQLVCLVRTLLRKTKMLILDEATAAVDMESDDLIQNTIRTEFADCTVLTIAHRLNTIMDSDRVLVLNQGQVAEFDSPANLLADENSIFAGMVEESRLQTSDPEAQRPDIRRQLSNG